MKYLYLLVLTLLFFSCNRKTASLPKSESSAPVLVNDVNFDQAVLENDQLVVVDFFADWCGPCKLFEPAFRDLARDFSGEVKFATIDYDNNQLTAYQYEVVALPTIILFKDGREVHRLVGMTTREHLRGKIRQYK